MPLITPFRGVVYNQEKAGDPSLTVCPPYDIIPSRIQDELYRKSPYNFVRLELNRIEPSDNDENNRYTRAQGFFEEWLRDNILVQDKAKSLYIYSQKYKERKRAKERIGFIGLMALDKKGADKVLPHENTLEAPKADRLRMMHSVKANLSPIFVLYEDNAHKILKILKDTYLKSRPFINIEIDGVRNRVWRLSDEAKIARIEAALKGKDIFIADGHHRYETSRNYRAEIQNDKDAPLSLKNSSGYIMVYFVESDEKMLTILAAHRVVKDIGSLKKDDIPARLGKFFSVRKVPGIARLMPALAKMSGEHAFGMYLGKNEFYILKLKSTRESDKVVKDKPKDWKRLDVAILHRFIFQYVLGVRDEEDNIEFLRDPQDAVSFVDEGKGVVAFFLNPTKASQVKRIARLGLRMPRKATYFYPKQLSGLVVNKLG